jgi:hypothetical protein
MALKDQNPMLAISKKQPNVINSSQTHKQQASLLKQANQQNS